MRAGVNVHCAISDTAVTSAAVPVMKHSEKPDSSSGMMRRSITSIFCGAPDDHGRARDAGEEAIGDRGVDLAVFDEEDVGAGAFGDAALPVEHHGVGIAALFGAVLGDGADHVEAGRLGKAGRGLRIGAAIVGQIEADALEALRRIEIARPFPGGDGEVNLILCAETPSASEPRQAIGRT